MLYVGLIRHEGVDMMYVSSVAEDEDHDTFEKSSKYVPFTTPAALRGDPVAQRAETQHLANVLTDGGAIVTIETV